MRNNKKTKKFNNASTAETDSAKKNLCWRVKVAQHYSLLETIAKKTYRSPKRLNSIAGGKEVGNANIAAQITAALDELNIPKSKSQVTTLKWRLSEASKQGQLNQLVNPQFRIKSEMLEGLISQKTPGPRSQTIVDLLSKKLNDIGITKEAPKEKPKKKTQPVEKKKNSGKLSEELVTRIGKALEKEGGELTKAFPNGIQKGTLLLLMQKATTTGQANPAHLGHFETTLKNLNL